MINVFVKKMVTVVVTAIVKIANNSDLGFDVYTPTWYNCNCSKCATKTRKDQK